MMPAISTVDLVKVYPNGVRALAGVSLEVERGEVFGVLGPNGAGKTTLIRILVTLLRATQGTACLGGHDVERDARLIRSQVGYVPQVSCLDPDLTVRENLSFSARLYHLSKHLRRSRMDELIAQFGLESYVNMPASLTSGGIRRRVSIAQALIHQPSLLFVDEPTVGLDPASRRSLWDYISQSSAAGMTIVLTTQYLDEAESLCHRLAIVKAGELIAIDTPEGLKSRLGDRVLTISLPETSPAYISTVTSRLEGTPGIAAVRYRPNALSVHLTSLVPMTALLQSLEASDICLSNVNVEEPTLEDAFLALTSTRRTPEISGN